MGIAKSIRTFFRRSQARLYSLGIGCSIFASVGGVLYGAFVSKKCVDGQRGGAIGTAAVFLILFLSRNYGEYVYEAILDIRPHLRSRMDALSKPGPVEVFSQEDLTWLTIAILGKLKVAASEQQTQNVYIAIASVIGTLAWGFGDIIAGWISGCKS